MSKYNKLKNFAAKMAVGVIGAGIMAHAGLGLANADEAQPAKPSRTLATLMIQASDSSNYDASTVFRNKKGEMCVRGHIDSYKTIARLRSFKDDKGEVYQKAVIDAVPDGPQVDRFIVNDGFSITLDSKTHKAIHHTGSIMGAKADDLAMYDGDMKLMAEKVSEMQSILKAADQDPRFQPVKAALGSAKLAVDADKKPEAGKQKFKVKSKGMSPGS